MTITGVKKTVSAYKAIENTCLSLIVYLNTEAGELISRALSKERALEFWHMDIPVFLLYPDDTEAQVDYEEDIENHDGMCGIEYDEWEEIAWQI